MVALFALIASVVSGLMLGARQQNQVALSLADLRRSITDLELYQERLENGDGTQRDNRAEVRPAFNEVYPNLLELDEKLAVRMRGTLDRYLAGLDTYEAARSAQRPDAAETEERNAALGQELDDALTLVMTEARRRSDAATQRSIAGLWASAVIAAMACIAITRRALRASEIASANDRDRLADERLRALVAHNDEVLMVYGPKAHHVLYVAPSIERVLGYSVDEFMQHPSPEAFLHTEDVQQWMTALQDVAANPGAHHRLEVRALHANRHLVHLETDITNLVDEASIGGVVINARDVSERINLQQDLAHQATHDVLTGLANRLWFSDQVTRALCGGAPDPSSIAVVLVDLDGFKEINDSLGHGAGDEVLITVAARLSTLTRQRDCVARLGGDEFALLLVGDHTLPLASRIVECLREPIELDVGPITIGGSVGVATAGEGADVASLLRDADAAMYDAKAKGKNRVSVFADSMHASLLGRLQLRADLDAALANDEFKLVYQPKLSLQTAAVEGFEALLRWHRADGSVVPPIEFIPVAEATGQIVAIGEWVLRTALHQLADWQHKAGEVPLSMAVNVSTRQLASPGFVITVRDALLEAGVAPQNVTLEITETMLVEDENDAARVLSGLRRLGVLIAVDDYGAGHASIGYLRKLPVDVLKIDRSFIAALETCTPEAEAYLRSITDLARALHLDTVAEGIEHESQLRHLRELGCHSGQGYHLARPLSVQDATDFLASHRTVSA